MENKIITDAVTFDDVLLLPARSDFLPIDSDTRTRLTRRIEQGEIDPSFVITHNCDLDDGPAMYKKFRDKEDGCIKVVLRP